MAEEIQLPQLGESVTEGIITQWLVEVGDEVEEDQPIAEISTDKVDTEIPSPVAGVIQELRVQVDDTVQPGDVLAIVGESAPSEGAEDGGAEEEEASAEDEEAGAAEPDEKEDEEAAAEDEEQREQTAPEQEPAPEPSEKDRGGPAGRVERTEDHDYDVIIIGAGTGGYSAALRAAQLDLSVAMIEKEKVGGTCLHWGCIPTKAVLQSAEVAEQAQEAGDFGVTLDYDGIEVAAMNEHKDSVVDKMYKGLQGALNSRGVETIKGTAKLTGEQTVEVDLADGDTQTISAPAIIVATGSKPTAVPFAEYDGEKIINSDHALYLEELPDSAIILGSGAVGMEFATAWHAFGVEVTVVELLDTLLPNEDADTSKEIARQFRRRGIETMTGTKMTSVETGDGGVTCTVESAKGDEEKLEAEVLLVAVGRTPVSDGVGLEEVGIETDNGYVLVDEYCRTNVDGIFAIGDVIPTLGLAHASFAEGYLVADQLAGLEVLPIDYKGVPRVTYCHPEVASVGYNQQDAEDEGYEVVVEKHPFQALGRAAMMNASGSIKVIAEKDDDAEGGAGRILGIHIVGPRATDLISEGQLVYNWEALASDVARHIHAHPSLGEAMGEATLALAGRALHGT